MEIFNRTAVTKGQVYSFTNKYGKVAYLKIMEERI